VAGPATLRPRASRSRCPAGAGCAARPGQPTGPGLAAGHRGREPGRGAARSSRPADQRIGKIAVDRGERQPGHPPELVWPAAHRLADRAAGPRLPSTPQTVTITSPHGTRQASIGAGGLVRFPAPLTTDRIDVSFRACARPPSFSDTVSWPRSRSGCRAVGARPGRLRAVTPDQQARFSWRAARAGADRRRAGLPDGGQRHGRRAERVPAAAGPGVLPRGTLSLRPGASYLTAAAPGTFAVTDSVWPPSPPARRPYRVRRRAGRLPRRDRPQLEPDQRQVSIGPGAASYLEMPRELQRRLERHAERAATDARCAWTAGSRASSVPAGRAGRSRSASGRRDVSSHPRRVAGRRRHPARHRGLVPHQAPASRRRTGPGSGQASGQRGRGSWAPSSVAAGGGPRRAWLGASVSPR